MSFDLLSLQFCYLIPVFVDLVAILGSLLLEPRRSHLAYRLAGRCTRAAALRIVQ